LPCVPNEKAGLSLGDQACLALAEQLKMPLLTADRSWKELKMHVDIQPENSRIYPVKN
jgi:PIN domain nuclease of toxin-antitoxin system